MLTETEQTRNHELGTVADGVDGAVLDDNPLVRSEQRLEGRNDLAQVRLVQVVVMDVLGVENVVKGDQVVVLAHGTTPDTPELLHVCANTKKKTQVDAESTNVGTSLAADPEDTEVAVVVEFDQLALVNGTDTELALDGGDERGTLEQGSGKSLESAGKLGLAAGNLVVETDDADILLTGALLRLDETSGTVDADNQAASDLGVESTAVTSLLDTENSLDPRDDFVTGGVGGLVEVDDAGRNVALQVALVGSAAVGNGNEVTATDEQLVVVLQQERPLAGVDLGRNGLRLDGVVRILGRDYGGHCGYCNSLLAAPSVDAGRSCCLCWSGSSC